MPRTGKWLHRRYCDPVNKVCDLLTMIIVLQIVSIFVN